MHRLKFLSSTALLFTLAFLFSFNVNAQSRTDRVLLSQAERVTNDQFKVFMTTPKGARIYAVNRPKSKMLQAIDAGLRNLFAVARKNGFGRNLNYSDYTIFIARPDRTRDGSGRYSPDIAVNSAQYAGSVYDQGGYIYAAGMVLGYQPGAFIIAEHSGNLQRVSEVVRYEGEHIVLYHNHRRLYNQTADHSRGGGHPILQ